jgi:Zn-ribbon protein, possibly nucleic acid-binding
MSLGKILEYQEIDQKIYREEMNLRRSPEATRMGTLSGQLNSVQQNLMNLDKEAEALFREVNSSESKLNNLANDERVNFSASGVTALADADRIEKALNAHIEELNAIERDVKKSFKRLQDLSAEVNKQKRIYLNMQKEYGNLRADFNRNAEELRNKYRDLNDALNNLKKDIPPELLAAYKNLRDARKMPAFVPYENGSCAACGMRIIEIGAKLKNPGDTAECPNCRRILYLK